MDIARVANEAVWRTLRIIFIGSGLLFLTDGPARAGQPSTSWRNALASVGSATRRHRSACASRMVAP